MNHIRNITKIVRNMMQYRNTVTKKEVLNSNEFEALRFISKHQYLSAVDVVHHLNVDKALVTRILKRLEALKYIIIKPDPIDKRKKTLAITDHGQKFKMDEISDEIYFYEMCIKDFSDIEKNQLLLLIEKMYVVSKQYRKTSFEGLRRHEPSK